MLLHEPLRAERLSVQLAVKIFLDGQPYRTDLINLSLTGAFLELDPPLDPGTRLELLLPIPGGSAMRVRCAVVRSGTCQKFLARPDLDNLAVSASGVGIVFDDLDDPEAQRLQDYLDLLLDR